MTSLNLASGGRARIRSISLSSRVKTFPLHGTAYSTTFADLCPNSGAARWSLIPGSASRKEDDLVGAICIPGQDGLQSQRTGNQRGEVSVCQRVLSHRLAQGSGPVGMTSPAGRASYLELVKVSRRRSSVAGTGWQPPKAILHGTGVTCEEPRTIEVEVNAACGSLEPLPYKIRTGIGEKSRQLWTPDSLDS